MSDCWEGARCRAATLAHALQLANANDAPDDNPWRGNRQLEAGAVLEHQRRRATHTELFAPEFEFLLDSRADIVSVECLLRVRHIAPELAHKFEEHLGPSDIAALGEERAAHTQVERVREPLVLIGDSAHDDERRERCRGQSSPVVNALNSAAGSCTAAIHHSSASNSRGAEW